MKYGDAVVEHLANEFTLLDRGKDTVELRRPVDTFSGMHLPFKWKEGTKTKINQESIVLKYSSTLSCSPSMDPVEKMLALESIYKSCSTRPVEYSTVNEKIIASGNVAQNYSRPPVEVIGFDDTKKGIEMELWTENKYAPNTFAVLADMYVSGGIAPCPDCGSQTVGPTNESLVLYCAMCESTWDVSSSSNGIKKTVRSYDGETYKQLLRRYFSEYKESVNKNPETGYEVIKAVDGECLYSVGEELFVYSCETFDPVVCSPYELEGEQVSDRTCSKCGISFESGHQLEYLKLDRVTMGGGPVYRDYCNFCVEHIQEKHSEFVSEISYPDIVASTI